jgi:hypothetical protein
MSRAYKNRKKNREIGDLTYPSGGSRVSCNAFLSQVRRTKKKLRKEGNPLPPNASMGSYGGFLEIGNKVSESGE